MTGPLTVLLVHEWYRQPGGEDAAVDADAVLLAAAGHRVVRHERSNDEIHESGAAAKLRLAAGTLWSASSARTVAQLMDEVRPDVVHLHNTVPLLSPAVAATAARRGVPVVQTLQNLRLVCAQGLGSRDGRPCDDCLRSRSPVPALRYACYRGSRAQTAVIAAWQLEQRLLERVRHPVALYLPVSAALRDALVGAGALPAGRAMVRHNHVADPGPRAAGEDRGTMVFAGRVVRDKGIEVLVRAAARVPEVPVAVAGDGPDRPAAAALAERLGAGNVGFLGRLPRQELFGLLRGARALVQPSVCEDPNPLAVLEAGSLGVPAIAAAVGGLPEMVGDAGALFPAGDVDSLAAILRQAWSDATGWAERGQRARQRYEANFSPERAYDTLIAAYRRAGVAC